MTNLPNREAIQALLDALPGVFEREIKVGWPCDDQVSLLSWESDPKSAAHHLDDFDFKILAESDNLDHPAWQLIGQSVQIARAAVAALDDSAFARKAFGDHHHEICNTLAAALGFPMGPHEVICPMCQGGPCQQVDVCRTQAEWGEHTAETLAAMAAEQLSVTETRAKLAEAEVLKLRAALAEALTVLDEVARLDKARKEQSAKLQMLAKRARAGETITHGERDEARVVVDFGDVWEQLLAVRPKLAKALKVKKPAFARVKASR